MRSKRVISRARWVVPHLRRERRTRREHTQLTDALEHLAALRNATGYGTYTWLPAQDRFTDSSDILTVLGLGESALPAGSTFAGYMAFVHPADRDLVRQQAEAVLSGTDNQFRTAHRLVVDRGDGPVERWVEHSGQVYRDQCGTPVRVVGVVTDTTAQRLQDQATLRLSKFEAIATMTSGIAHDFNNVLGPILSYAELAKEEVLRGASPLESLTEIEHAAERAKRMVQRLLAFTREEQPSREQFLLGDLVSEACALMRAGLPRAATLTCCHAEHLPPIVGDPTMIHQVIVNLLTNALQAIAEDGTIRVDVDEVTITDEPPPGVAGKLEPGQYLRLRVQDDGPGIAPDVADKIFDPFFTTKPAGTGTGLGLAATQGAVRQHGGAIMAENAPAGGAVFCVFLPASGRNTSLSHARVEPPHGQPAVERPHVLFVDDEELLVRMAARQLESAGCSLDVFTSPTTALASLKSAPTKFDALVTDLSMPEMTGDQLIRRARALRPGLAAVLTSGSLTEADQRWANDQRVVVVPKPWSAEVIATAVQRAIALARTPS